LAIIFLIHPQNNEAVVYIANLQDPLFVFFGLLGLLVLVYSPQRYPFALVWLFLSLLSKETGIAFLGVSFVYAAFFQPKKLPFLTIGIAGVLFCYFFLRGPIAHIGTAHIPLAPITLATISERLLTIPAIIFFYFSTFFFPFHISALHFWVVQKPNFSQFLVPLVLVLSGISILVWYGTTLFRSKSKLTKLFLFFCCWVIMGIVLHLHLFAVLDATAADRWFYFPFIGLLGIGGVLASTISFPSLRFKKLTTCFFILLFIALGIRTYIRNYDWKDTLTLYEHDSKETPANFLTNNALGTEYINTGDYDKAKPLILASVIEYPYFANLNNAAIIALHEKNPELARKYLEEALKKSNNYLVSENYSSFLMKYGTKQEAKDFTQQAVQRYPQSIKLKKNLLFLQK
jgi:hypothetical protein